ncbi:pteridine reductase [Pseudoalteromonas tunicata]|jgi:pteridine reductase|uniref:Pteridine reductase n=1 Tax=Pseudoalteromonas tunicata D2 TaxID=87626 RepID=A4C862_9GAMM|nr:pteridine reductase [Pseudoalteromonas tunicata]ATC93281.1 pteridine reductase [Pseudoalteromonas tunicata]EAR28777.1 pteridine reductase [Pseudoalteromonas tunicata D2]
MVAAEHKVVLITGAAKRVGAYLCKYFHHKGCNVVIHYHSSKVEALQLEGELNRRRINSAKALCGQFACHEEYRLFQREVESYWGRVDVLINNASSFFPTPIGNATVDDAQALLHSNLIMPTLLIQAFAKALQTSGGCVINILDIYAQSPLRDHMLYCAAKAGLASVTKSVAKELAPDVRSNAIAPGNIIWPSDCTLSQPEKQWRLAQIPLQRQGHPQDIAKAAYFLAFDADYVTGQVLNVDGGKAL